MYKELREDEDIEEIPAIEAWLKEENKPALLKQLITDKTPQEPEVDPPEDL